MEKPDLLEAQHELTSDVEQKTGIAAVFLQQEMAEHDADELAASLDAVTIDLYKEADKMKKGQNFTVSPVSVIYCTALAYAGARGKTKLELEKALHLTKFGGKSEDVQSALSNVLDKMNLAVVQPQSEKVNVNQDSESEPEPPLRYGPEPSQLTLANAVYVEKSIQLKSEYRDVVQNKLKAAVENKDFENNPEESRKEINTWVEKHTNNKIQELLPAGSVKDDTIAVLINAVYFKGVWSKKFEESWTEKRPFFQTDGSTKQVDTMRTEEKFSYAENSKLGLQYLEINYGDSDASMLILLPRERNGLTKLEAALSSGVLASLAQATTRDREVQLQLPKFRIEGAFDLKELLQKIGVKEIFSRADADLTGIMASGKRVVITEAFHKTFIDVDENGTEAAAASTMIAVMLCSLEVGGPEPIQFTVDHPFLFAIRHNATKLILFIGRVESF